MSAAHKSRAVVVTGPPGSGKSTLAQQLALRSLQQGQRVLWIDADHSFTPMLCRELMQYREGLCIHRPVDIRTTTEICMRLMGQQSIHLVVIDPLEAIPWEEEEGHGPNSSPPNPLLRRVRLACHMNGARLVIVSLALRRLARAPVSWGTCELWMRSTHHIRLSEVQPTTSTSDPSSTAGSKAALLKSW